MNPYLMIFQREMTPIRKLLLMHLAAGGKLTDYTVVGNPVSFDTNVAKPLSECLLSFLPVQSGSGDPSPDNVRPVTGWTGAKAYKSGANIFNPKYIEQNTETRVSIGGRYGYYDIQLSAGTYTIAIGYKSSNAYSILCKGEHDESSTNLKSAETLTTPYIQTKTFTLDNSDSYYFWLYRSAGYGGASADNVAWISLVEGSEALIPESVSVTFPAQGKNLLNTGNATHNSYNIGNIPNTLKPNTTYTYSINGTTTGRYRLYFGYKENPLSAVTPLSADYVLAGNSNTFTTPEVMGDILVMAGDSSGVGNEALSEILPMIEEGPSKTAYEPYTNTVYGGTLDLTTGVLTVDRKIIANKWSQYTNSSDRGDVTRRQLNLSDDVVNADRNDLCNVAKFETSYNGNFVHFYVNGTNKRIFLFLPNGISEDTDVTVCYRLAIPFVYQLTPQQIETLIGTNVLWCDLNGDMEVKYLKKG